MQRDRPSSPEDTSYSNTTTTTTTYTTDLPRKTVRAAENPGDISMDNIFSGSALSSTFVETMQRDRPSSPEDTSYSNTTTTTTTYTTDLPRETVRAAENPGDISMDNIFSGSTLSSTSVETMQRDRLSSPEDTSYSKTTTTTTTYTTDLSRETVRAAENPGDISMDDIFPGAAPSSTSVEPMQRDCPSSPEDTSYSTTTTTTNTYTTDLPRETLAPVQHVPSVLSSASPFDFSSLVKDAVHTASQQPSVVLKEKSNTISPSRELDLDAVFNVPHNDQDEEECNCSACRDSKLSEEELAARAKKNVDNIVSETIHTTVQPRKKTSLPDADISIDDIFNPAVPTTSKDHSVGKDETSYNTTTTTTTTYTTDLPRETMRTAEKPGDISMDDIFSGVSPSSTSVEPVQRDRPSSPEDTSYTTTTTTTTTYTTELLRTNEFSLDDIFIPVVASSSRESPDGTSLPAQVSADLVIDPSHPSDLIPPPKPPRTREDSPVYTSHYRVQPRLKEDLLNKSSRPDSMLSTDSPAFSASEEDVLSRAFDDAFQCIGEEDCLCKTCRVKTDQRSKRRTIFGSEPFQPIATSTLRKKKSKEGLESDNEEKSDISMVDIFPAEKSNEQTLIGLSVGIGQVSVGYVFPSTSDETSPVSYSITTSASAVRDPVEGKEKSYSTNTTIASSFTSDSKRSRVNVETDSPTRTIDAAFKDVFDDYSSMGSSVSRTKPAVISLDQVFSCVPRQDYASFYDDRVGEDEKGMDEIDVKEFVDDLLAESMEEATWRTALRRHNKVNQPAKLSGVDFSSSYQDGPSEPRHKPKPAHLYQSSIEQPPGRLEEVISCPSSAVNSPIAPRKPSQTVISRASVVLDGSTGDKNNDYIIKLIFNETKPVEQTQPINDQELHENVKTMTTASTERETYVYGMAERANEDDTRRTESWTEVTTTATITSTEDVERVKEEAKKERTDTDTEWLEVEVTPAYFVIRGNYELVVQKNDPLGRLLSELASQGGLAQLDFAVAPRLRELLNTCLREKAFSHSPSSGSSLSHRIRHLFNDDAVANKNMEAVARNRFSRNNPTGVVNLCTAENQVCADLVRHRLGELEWRAEEVDRLQRYPPAGGWETTRQALARFLSAALAPVPADELVLVPSVASAWDMLAFTLAEQGDVILTSSPVYNGILTDCEDRARCKVVTVPTRSRFHPSLEVRDFQRALDKCIEEGDVVRLLAIVSPHNPLGVVWTEKELIALCNWATERDMTVLIDEVFAMSVFGGVFSSALSWRTCLSNPDKVVWLWGVSKDLGLPGARLAVVHSPSLPTRKALQRLELIQPVSTLAQIVVERILEDRDFVDRLTRCTLDRLRSHRDYLARALEKMGVPYVDSRAGLCIMTDFRKLLTDQSFQAEKALFESICKSGVYLTRGEDMRCEEPGWMRIAYGCPREELEEGVRRLFDHFHVTAIAGAVQLEG